MKIQLLKKLQKIKINNPGLFVQQYRNGTILEIQEKKVLCKFEINSNDYLVEMKKEYFPKNLKENNVFLMVSGILKKKKFIHIEFYKYSRLDILKIKQLAKKLEKVWNNNNINYAD